MRRMALIVLLTATVLLLSSCATTGAKALLNSKDEVIAKIAAGAEKRDDIPKITIEQAKVLFDSGAAVFVDARSEREYKQEHIKGAVSMPSYAVKGKLEKYKNKLKGKILISYCHGAGCHLADKTAFALFREGYKNVAIFFGGWPKWNEHKYPVEK